MECESKEQQTNDKIQTKVLKQNKKAKIIKRKITKSNQRLIVS